jgi:dihydroxyacetone kinase-like predicted kinase
VDCAVVAVASGPGLSELFGQLGVQGVVSGGQTLNPSTAELLSAVEAVNSDHVVVLPNNKNIIPVAEQLEALTTKHVVVVPTRSMPEGLAALVVYDPGADSATNGEEMTEAAEAVVTGELTQAVRDTRSDIGDITKGDWIGIVRGDGNVSCDTDPVQAAVALLDHIVADTAEILTIIEGTEVQSGQTEALTEWLAERHPNLEVEVHRGGQPLYPYLFGVE